MHNEQENYFCHEGFLDQKIICTENSTHRLPVVVSRCYLQSCNGLNQVRVVSLSETEQQCSCLVEHLLDSAYSHRSTGHGTSSVLHRCRSGAVWSGDYFRCMYQLLVHDYHQWIVQLGELRTDKPVAVPDFLCFYSSVYPSTVKKVSLLFLYAIE